MPIPRSDYFYEVAGKYLHTSGTFLVALIRHFLPIFCSSAEISAQWPEMKNLLEKTSSTSSRLSLDLLILGSQIKYKIEKIMFINRKFKIWISVFDTFVVACKVKHHEKKNFYPVFLKK